MALYERMVRATTCKRMMCLHEGDGIGSLDVENEEECTGVFASQRKGKRGGRGEGEER